jgi:hypothetical protein
MTTEHCENCGHEYHEGPLWREEKDYDGRTYQVKVCDQGRKKK